MVDAGGMWRFRTRGRRKKCGQATLRGVDRSTRPPCPCRTAPVLWAGGTLRAAARAGAAGYLGGRLLGGAIGDGGPGHTPLSALVSTQTSSALCPLPSAGQVDESFARVLALRRLVSLDAIITAIA